VTMGATLAWPAMAVLGFVVLTCLVVALGTSSTARYEFEHNGTRDRQGAETPAHDSHPAGSRSRRRAAGSTRAAERPQAVDVAVRPAPAAATGGPGWWLVDDAAHVLAGPFADQVEADWAALSEGLPAVSVHGIRRPDGGVTLRTSPEERTFLTELGEQLDRLPHEWDDLLNETDPLTTLVVEVAAALVEAGLPLHDASQDSPSGGVCLLPETTSGGVLVSWRAHDRMSVHDLRGAAATDTVQQSMNVAVADILWNVGFVVHPVGATGTSLVTALR
jgi:hypothetical protein